MALKLRVVGEPDPGRANPLIAALIEHLPAPGTSWPAADRQVWLTMMEQAFNVVYGIVGSAVRSSAMRSSAPAVPARSPKKKRPSAKRPKPPRVPKAARPAGPPPEFYIDAQGYARNGSGDSILPEDVNDILYDRRGESGDLGAIIWADGSRGIPKGMRLDISTAV